MKKTIKQLRIDATLLMLSIIVAAVFFHISSYSVIPTDKEILFYEKTKAFIEKTNDMEKLKRITNRFLESDESHMYYIKDQLINARNIAIVFSIFPILITIRVFRLHKQFLTSSSSGT